MDSPVRQWRQRKSHRHGLSAEIKCYRLQIFRRMVRFSSYEPSTKAFPVFCFAPVSCEIKKGRCQDLFSTEAKQTSTRSAEVRGPRGQQREGVIVPPAGVRGRTPAAKRFSLVLSVQNGLSRQFSVVLYSLFHSNNFCQGSSRTFAGT